MQFQREHAPIFNVVIELQRGETDAWTVYRPVADIVDSIYADKPYTVERRVRELGPGGTKLYVWREAPREGERMGMGPDGQVSA